MIQVTTNPKHADVIEASGEVFEYVRQTQPVVQTVEVPSEMSEEQPA